MEAISSFHWKKDGQWFHAADHQGKLGCCDCGLVHDIRYRLNGQDVTDNIELSAVRNEEDTALLRRHTSITNPEKG